jgi:hypothetical protein
MSRSRRVGRGNARPRIAPALKRCWRRPAVIVVRFAVERSAVVVVGYPDDLEPCCPEHGKDLAHGNSVVFSDSPSVPETSIHLSVELQQVRPRKTSPDALSRNVLPTRFWSRMLGAPGRRRANASSKPSASI